VPYNTKFSIKTINTRGGSDCRIYDVRQNRGLVFGQNSVKNKVKNRAICGKLTQNGTVYECFKNSYDINTLFGAFKRDFKAFPRLSAGDTASKKHGKRPSKRPSKKRRSLGSCAINVWGGFAPPPPPRDDTPPFKARHGAIPAYKERLRTVSATRPESQTTAERRQKSRGAAALFGADNRRASAALSASQAARALTVNNRINGY
jgi:hypothetical protein